ncbi:MAG: diguanylate cyclase [Lachnospiraceae bacterium]|nr:diguanylate cyclase [Lachnospiraceae bacterium]
MKHTAFLKDNFFLILFVIFSLAVIMTDRDAEMHYPADYIPMTEGWTDEGGRPINLDDLPAGPISLTKDIDGYDTEGRRLCTKSVDTVFDVYADGRLIYSYRPKLPKLLGASYGMSVHGITIPAGTRRLGFQVEPIFPGNAPNLLDAVIGDSGTYMIELLKGSAFSIIRSGLIMLTGLVFLLTGLLNGLSRKKTGIDFISFGTMCALLGLSGLNETYLLQIITMHPAVIRVVVYVCLMFLPYMALSFFAEAVGNRDTRLLPVMLVLCLLNFASTVLLTYMGITDYFYMVTATHLIILAGFAMVIFLAVRGLRKQTVKKTLVRNLIIGVSASIAGVIIDVFRYQVLHCKTGYSEFTRIGMMILLILMCIYLFRERTQDALERSKMEIRAKMAFTDGLTQMKNRLAFGQREQELHEEGKRCCIIQLDINNLKIVNDIYGHAEGDLRIKTAAQMIQDAFGNIGDCYRTGGDEFIVIGLPGISMADAGKAWKVLEEKESEYNRLEDPPVPLGIAFGLAEFDPPSVTLEEAEKTADDKMYECKQKMKELTNNPA